MFVRHRLVAGALAAALLVGPTATLAQSRASLTGARNLSAVRLLGSNRTASLSGALFSPNTCYSTQFQTGILTVFPPTLYLAQKVFNGPPGRLCGMVARWIPTRRVIPAPRGLRWITVRAANGTFRIPIH
ncbi:MAG: hypothetical protein ABSD03_02255 [Vulcanimicrobiaceae bacterium]|jgi:hypothetical protein